jgi:hypothetical protein
MASNTVLEPYVIAELEKPNVNILDYPREIYRPNLG